MVYDPDEHHRRSIRMKGYDYSQECYYFITICTQKQQQLFGSIENDRMVINNAGKMVSNIWNELKRKFAHIAIHKYIVMPNHFHGIIEIINESDVGADLCVCPQMSEIYTTEIEHSDKSLSTMIQWFKTMSTNAYIRGVKYNNWQRFDLRLLQRNYYEHIIRTEKSLAYISEYIETNPQQWQADEYRL